MVLKDTLITIENIENNIIDNFSLILQSNEGNSIVFKQVIEVYQSIFTYLYSIENAICQNFNSCNIFQSQGDLFVDNNIFNNLLDFRYFFMLNISGLGSGIILAGNIMISNSEIYSRKYSNQ